MTRAAPIFIASRSNRPQASTVKDFFGTAYGYQEGKYDGFKLDDTNVQLDDTLLLIEPAAAVEYQAAQVKPVGSSPGAVTISTPPSVAIMNRSSSTA